jgi:hypothetical protein
MSRGLGKNQVCMLDTMRNNGGVWHPQMEYAFPALGEKATPSKIIKALEKLAERGCVKLLKKRPAPYFKVV